MGRVNSIESSGCENLENGTRFWKKRVKELERERAIGREGETEREGVRDREIKLSMSNTH